MAYINPEQRARQATDEQLVAVRWIIQDYRQFNSLAGRGNAVREAPLKPGTCDYLLLMDRKSAGVIEAKKEGTLLSGVAEQSSHYAENVPDFMQSVTKAGEALAVSSPSVAPKLSPHGLNSPTLCEPASPRCPKRTRSQSRTSATARSKASPTSRNPSPPTDLAPSSRWRQVRAKPTRRAASPTA